MESTTQAQTLAGQPVDNERRAALVATCVLGGAGVIAAAAPYVASWGPSEREKAAGAPVEVDLSTIPAGQMKVVEWRGKPVWVLHRTPEMIATLKSDADRLADPESERTAYPTPSYALADRSTRSIKPEFFIAVGICTHLGCSPSGPFVAGENSQLGTDPGFVCPCHGSTFDLAGRVFKNKPASDNLQVPPHKYLDEKLVLIGDDSKA
jgi:ubiquinol-cytochrome c reductase iron-sulfur subunit